MTASQIESYIAGYHRGLNTEYHGEDVLEMFNEWDEGGGDEKGFFEGFNEGFRDYKSIMARFA